MKTYKKFNPENVAKVAKILNKHDKKLPIECIIDLAELIEKKK